MKIILIALLSLFLGACQNEVEEKIEKDPLTQKCWDENSVFPLKIDADQYPSYKAGNDALSKFLSEEIKYPTQAKEQGEEGKVFVQFVVRIDGSVDGVSVVRGVSKALDEESIRVAKMTSGKWNPGKKDGMSVNATMTLPIHFKLQ